MSREAIEHITSVLHSRASRPDKAARIADLIRRTRNFRWVGVYEVGQESVSILAYSGPGAPAYPQFPVTKGLTGSAIRERRTIVVGDVRNDPRYLTAFGSTLSEMIIPILNEKTGDVVGTIDVESEQANAFSLEDQKILEECARAARLLWETEFSAARDRRAEIKKRARKRGLILLRCPHCRHYLVAITAKRGDFRKNGHRSNLYCSWPYCWHYGEQVAVTEAVLGQWPRDGSKCCIRPMSRIVHD